MVTPGAPAEGHSLDLDLPDLAATMALGGALARLCAPGDLIALAGPLGAGKTALARAIIQALLPGEEVPSPTFSLVQTYEAPGRRIVHVDLYRLESADEIGELGLEDALAQAVVLVEWPERLDGLRLGPDRLDIRLARQGRGEGRVARLKGHGRWGPLVEKIGHAA